MAQTNSPPSKLKRKTVYFLKLQRVALVKEDIDKLVGAKGCQFNAFRHCYLAATVGLLAEPVARLR